MTLLEVIKKHKYLVGFIFAIILVLIGITIGLNIVKRKENNLTKIKYKNMTYILLKE